MKWIGVLALTLLCQSTLALDIAAYEKAKELPDARKINEMYITGVGQGILWANAAVTKKTKAPLYCPPESLPLNGQNYMQLIDQYLQFLRSKPGFDESAPVELVLMRALQDNFPCKS